MQRNDGDDEADRKHHHNERVDLQTWRLVRVQSCAAIVSPDILHHCRTDRGYALSIVLLLPPAPAARVLDGRALAILSARSAAAFLLIAVAGPPGAFGDAARAVVEPVVGGEFTGEVGRGEDCRRGPHQHP